MSAIDDLAGDLCEGCGAPLSDDRDPRMTFCCRECWRRNYAAVEKSARDEARKDRVCVGCGKIVDPRRNKSAKYCSTICLTRTKNAAVRAARIAVRPLRTCGECGASLPDHMRTGTNYCGIACYRKARSRHKYGDRTCAVCGDVFVPTRERPDMCVPKRRFMECVERLKAKFLCEAVRAPE